MVVVYNAAVEHVCVLVISKGDWGVSQRERPLQGGDPRDRFVACSKPATPPPPPLLPSPREKKSFVLE